MDDLVYSKYICRCCGKTSIASSTEDIVKYDKKCTECFIISIVGDDSTVKGYKQYGSLDISDRNNLRRDTNIRKRNTHKKILSPKEKALVRQREEEKWEILRASWKSLELPNTSKSNSGE